MKVYLYNPSNGAPIKNWYDGNERWSLGIDEVMAFPTNTAEALRKVFGFLQEVNEEEFEAMVAKLEAKEKNPAKIKVDPSGELVAKSDEEIEKEVKEVKAKKESVKKILGKVKKADDAKPSNPPYHEWNRGEVFAECVKRGLEIKGLGKGRVSKEQLIALLENDDAQKE